MKTPDAGQTVPETLRALPGDEARAIMWRFADRVDFQMLVQSSRAVARNVVGKLVKDGGRHSHDWTPGKQAMLQAFDDAGITATFFDPEFGGFIEGPKNLATALITFELGWVDAGAATAGMAGNLGLAPIHERGTPAQRERYMRGSVPPAPGENRKIMRGAFALTEPLPYVGVETGILSGRVKVAEWKEGQEPLLQVDKRGRFITNMGYATFVACAVASGDPKFKGSCMIVVEEGDPGVFDRGTATRKLVHQLSSTHDPVFSVKIPASRIIGGYTVKDGVIIPNFDHGEVIDAVFRRTRVTVGLMSASKLISAVEPVIRYHRQRFRGAADVPPGTPRHELGLQQREDALHRLVDIWAAGEAGASLGFEAARLFDVLDPIEKKKLEVLAARGIAGGRTEIKALAAVEKDAAEFIDLEHSPEGKRNAARYDALEQDVVVQFVQLDSVANVYCPATKLFCGHMATMMREAVALVGGYGITEDCPGNLGMKWMDIQLEATYEGPEAVQRRQVGLMMTSDLFQRRYGHMMREAGELEAARKGLGAGILLSTMDLLRWTLGYLQKNSDAKGAKLWHSARHGVVYPMADALTWTLAARQLILDVRELELKGPANPALSDGLAGLVNFMSDLAHVQAARTAGEVSRICADLVYGYAPAGAPDLAAFSALRGRVEASLTGYRAAKDRAATALTTVMIPEALDY
ncbi:MAG: acyl-CoA dehydrogenase family protein [Candidatus Coatesbacteria bacterium]